MVVDEGNVNGEEGEGLEVVDPPMRPPLPPKAPQSPAPEVHYRPEGGGDPLVNPGAREGCAGDQPVFPSPAHSHMTVMWIFRRLIRCLNRRKEGEHRGTWGEDASRGGGGSRNPCLVPPSPPCMRPLLREVCPH